MSTSSIVARIGIATLCTGGVMALAMCGDDKMMNTVQDMAMSTADMTVPPTPDLAIVQPTVTTLSKTSDFTKGGTSIMINGTGFKSGATVKFGTLTAAVTNVTATAITVTVPANTGKPGKYDIVVTNTDGGTVTQSKGFAYTVEALTFDAAKAVTNAGMTVGMRGVYLADIDGKTGIDAITVNSVSNTYSVFTNDGAGALTAKTAVALTSCTTPFSATVAEVTGDALLDLVIPCRGSNNAVILKGNGDGTFTQQATALTFPTANSFAQSVAVLDVNNDQKVDLVFALNGTNTNNLFQFTGNGTGTFTAVATASQPASAINAAYSVTSADLDKDGKADLIATYTQAATADNVAVYLGKAFTTAVKYKSGGNNPYWLAVGDIDSTSAGLDFVASNNGGNGTIGNFSPFTVSDQGVVTAKTPVNTTIAMPEGIALGDLDVDGFLDVVTANPGGAAVTAGDLTTFQGDGKAGFATGKTLGTNGSATVGKPMAVAIADMNGDGRPDIVAVNYLVTAGQLVVLLNSSK